MALQCDGSMQPLWHLRFLSPTCNVQGPEWIKQCLLLQTRIYWRWDNVLQGWIWKKKPKNIQATYMFPSIYSEARQLACVCSCLGSLDCLLFVTAHRKQTEAVGQHWCTHTRGLIWPFLERVGWLCSRIHMLKLYPISTYSTNPSVFIDVKRHTCEPNRNHICRDWLTCLLHNEHADLC